jgi:2-polyprenyl-3-methyl-5-hydroxy-6-metoxy-1,4-benzoquinol methylase
VKAIDRMLQHWRIAQARPYISQGARVLDIGCADGAMFRRLGAQIGEGVGVDSALERSLEMEHYRLIRGTFPQDLPDDEPFDVITMLAILEHLPPTSHPALAQSCAEFLKPGGYLVITVPSAKVDLILSMLKFMQLIDGMSLDEHYGFDARRTPEIFSVGGLALIKTKRFQLGLNNLFVFQKTKER